MVAPVFSQCWRHDSRNVIVSRENSPSCESTIIWGSINDVLYPATWKCSDDEMILRQDSNERPQLRFATTAFDMSNRTPAPVSLVSRSRKLGASRPPSIIEG